MPDGQTSGACCSSAVFRGSEQGDAGPKPVRLLIQNASWGGVPSLTCLFCIALGGQSLDLTIFNHYYTLLVLRPAHILFVTFFSIHL